MSAEASSTPEETVEAPKARKTAASKRARKTSKTPPKAKASPAEKPVKEEPLAEAKTSPAPPAPEEKKPEQAQEKKTGETEKPAGWSASEALGLDPNVGPEKNKRKRRRKKNKGGQSQHPSQDGANETAFGLEADTSPETASAQPQQHYSRSKIDPEQLAKKAWKTFLAEVSEEGVALIDENDAKDLSRRCFRLAEIFLEEESRRH